MENKTVSQTQAKIISTKITLIGTGLLITRSMIPIVIIVVGAR